MLLVFGVLFLVSIVLLINQSTKFTGFATTATTSSNVTISSYFAIDMSVNLSNGIQFGSITTLPATSQNATHNYDGANTTAQGATLTGTNGTSMWMNVSTDSNTAVDFCIMADALNTSADDVIGLGNETYHNNTFTNSSQPAIGSEVSLTTGYVKAGYNVSVGGNNYYRFWLDVPAATVSGTYNNTVFFKGVAISGSCT